MDNPFLFGQTVGGTAFINRRKEIRDLSRTLTRGQSVIIFSPRRYGKTSLIKRVLREIQSKTFLTFYVDLYRITSLDQFYRNFAATISVSLQTPGDRLLEIFRTLVPSLKPRLVYAEPGMPSIEVEVTLEALKRSATLQELLNSVNRYCETHHKRACVVFDEFQELTVIESGNRLEREMRSAFQHHDRVSYAFLGSKAHLMDGIFRDKNRPFYHFGDHYELAGIDKQEWTAHIAAQFKRGGMSMTASHCDRILDISSGHPYYTQLLCSRLWDSIRDHGGMSEPLLEGILKDILARESHAFVEVWDPLTANQRRLLAAIAQEPDAPVFSAQFIGHHRLGASSSVSRALEQLIQRGLLIKNAAGVYVATDPLFMEWIKEKG